MAKKRIRLSQSDFDAINGFKRKHTREKFMCAKFLYREETVTGSTTIYSFRVYERARTIPYIILLPFVLVAQFFYCLWDGGLREYEWQGPTVMNRDIDMYTYPVEYQTCMDIWDERT